MTLAIGLTVWAVLSFPVALYAGPRLRSLTTGSPSFACSPGQLPCKCAEVRP
jgi:hypothetical protein